MRLFLIRHGESVDNVAGIYAGSRDALLTAHGALQASRLGSSLAHAHVLTHIFSSPLQRAVKTAEALRDAQNEVASASAPFVLHVPELREKDFGSLEGVSFRRGHPTCDDSEPKTSVTARAARFWDEHIVPLLRAERAGATAATCAIVAHGILLRYLARVLYERYSSSPQTGSSWHGPDPGFINWSNTGYLELCLSGSEILARADSANETSCASWHARVQQVNCITHLENLKKDAWRYRQRSRGREAEKPEAILLAGAESSARGELSN